MKLEDHAVGDLAMALMTQMSRQRGFLKTADVTVHSRALEAQLERVVDAKGAMLMEFHGAGEYLCVVCAPGALVSISAEGWQNGVGPQ